MTFEHLEDGSARSLYTAEGHLAGAPAVIHGGIQATLLDEVLGHAIPAVDGDPELDVVTVDFSLRYRRPAPTAVALTIRARQERAAGRDCYVSGEIVSPDGEVLTTAEARWRRLRST
jgi:acyl-coenzyme A thioesterase PaaI-like protein